MAAIDKNRISKILMGYENIRFAYIFGSQAKNHPRFGSDLDIAVYFEKEPDLDVLGAFVPDLEDAAGCAVDLVSLKDLYKKNPKLAFSVVADGSLLFTKDNTLLTHYKKNVFLYYLDFKPVIDLFTDKLYQRLNNRKFGKV